MSTCINVCSSLSSILSVPRSFTPPRKRESVGVLSRLTPEAEAPYLDCKHGHTNSDARGRCPGGDPRFHDSARYEGPLPWAGR